MLGRVILLCAVMVLAACGADNKWASDDAVSRAAFISGEPPSITLFTVVRKSNGEGGHSALMIDGSQRILFDPAGSWEHPSVPERHDVHYGITERMRKFFIDYHARENWDVVEQKVYVSPGVAEQAIEQVTRYGAVPSAFCANSTSDILRALPGFESIPRSFSPVRTMNAFGRLPGVTTDKFEDGDPANNSGVLIVQKSQL